MDIPKIEQAVRMIIEGIGDDPNRPGLAETPARVARMYEEIFGGIGHDPAEPIMILEEPYHDEIVMVKDIPFHSVCEHHFVPFLGRAHVAYIPDGGRVTGLSKLARVVDLAARRPQVQERLTQQIADTLMNSLQPQGVMVVMEAEHQCMTIRGVKKPGSKTVTSVVRGVFRRNAATRAEAMHLIRGV